VCQLRLRFLQRFFGPLAFGTVYDDGREKRQRTSSRRDQGSAEVRPDYIAVLAPVAFLDSVISSLPIGGLCENRFGAGTVLFMATLGSASAHASSAARQRKGLGRIRNLRRLSRSQRLEDRPNDWLLVAAV
jgi:hypothetical protein